MLTLHTQLDLEYSSFYTAQGNICRRHEAPERVQAIRRESDVREGSTEEGQRERAGAA